MIGWEDDNETVGPVALAAKESLLRALPHIMPPENADQSLYRLVLEHGNFGIHNTTITKEADGEPLVASLYDWETGCFIPALQSDPLVAAGPVDLITDENASPSVTEYLKMLLRPTLKHMQYARDITFRHVVLLHRTPVS
ncbi:hypothetical protein BDW59DRAFT_157613 [Aspergillus cavernicola]|uniref:Aminoglycoside phosphotransferase domain-containing protein n=1 Tax=Aspergillus cavernicola TaxID=176166 RepID=A0ABR4IZ56_9EURO